jgi:hypothetical protein
LAEKRSSDGWEVPWLPYFEVIMSMLQECPLPTRRQAPGFLSARFAVATSEPQPRRFSGLTSAGAEDLLDWLESQDISAQVYLSEGGTGFTVEYQGNP